MNKDGSIPVESEAGLRARLADEMRICLKKGGVRLNSGKVEGAVPEVVEEVVFELKPDLRDEVKRETARRTEGQRPAVIEGETA